MSESQRGGSTRQVVYRRCRVTLDDDRSFTGRIEQRGDLHRLWFVSEDGSEAEFRADLAGTAPRVQHITVES